MRANSAYGPRGHACMHAPAHDLSLASACLLCADCYVPPCARLLISCHPITGDERDYFMWADDVAPTIVCNESAPLDVCDEPEYCIPTTLACHPEPNR